MEHIVQFGISIDDERITSRIEEKAYKEIANKLYEDVRTSIFSRYNNDPSYYAQEKFDEFFDENRDAIIDMAAEYLADKLMRTKRGKAILEKYESVED